MIPFTVILPIHNEEDMIPITFTSIYDLKPDEVLILFDRCTDHSIPLAKKLVDLLDKEKVTNFITVNNPSPDWNFRCAYLRRKAYKDAAHDSILNTSADIILDPKIRDHLNLMNRYKLISFGYWDYPYNIQNFIGRLISRYTFIHGFAGLLALSRDAWMQTEDIEDLKTIPRGEDTHLHMAISSRYPVNHILTKSWHLRPNEEKINHYNRGQAKYTLLKQGVWKAFLHSIIMLRPAMLTGYLHAKRGILC